MENDNVFMKIISPLQSITIAFFKKLGKYKFHVSGPALSVYKPRLGSDPMSPPLVSVESLGMFFLDHNAKKHFASHFPQFFLLYTEIPLL